MSESKQPKRWSAKRKQDVVLRLCKAPEFLDTVLHKIHAASGKEAWAARTWAGVA